MFYLADSTRFAFIGNYSSSQPLGESQNRARRRNQQLNLYFYHMNLENSIKSNTPEFLSLCKSHDVKTLYAFGSATTDQFDETRSDIDLLVELDTNDPIERGEKLMALWEKFEGFFQRKVDLLTNSSIRNPFLQKSIDASKILIYDGQRKEISI